MTGSKQKITLVSILSIWLLGGILLFTASNAYAQTQPKKSDLYSQLQLFNEVLIKLKQTYVTDLSDEEIIKAAIVGMLGATDPHTNFFTPDDFADFTTSTKGEFGGLGIQIDKKGDYITVVSPIEGTPAYRLGIASGDRIIKVNGESVVGLTTDEAIKKMRGEVGSKVIITIARPGVSKPLDFDIVRAIIKIHSVPYSFVLDNGVGYIRISQFSENTSTELRSALADLEAKGITGLIMDLRFNPGGLLDQAIDTVNEFVGANKLVVETKGRVENTNRQYYTKYNTKERTYPIVILVNEASASASEIFAGSLQDFDKGLVVGRPTFGKGSVQQLFPLSNGNGIKITTSYYYIQSGRCIHKAINDKILKGESVSETDIKTAEKKSHEDIYYTVNKRKVYGGGGITPDLAFDSDLLTSFGAELRRKNVFFDFAVDYAIKNKDSITKTMTIDDKTMKSFLDYAKEKEIKFTPADVDSASAYIKNTIKSELVGKAFGEIEAYKISLNQDKQLTKAIELFDKYKTMDAMFKYAISQQPK
ncbi:MAG: phage tail protein [Candidatus Cloacimonetes bacterium HGW-Cloacimonetes-1]|jgi:carboxyl-terminal processing protease|nr:MAG: phage tail protein [Candidatus Cloacimonetes bacterium HGW-Cloacimonetes-1]